MYFYYVKMILHMTRDKKKKVFLIFSLPNTYCNCQRLYKLINLWRIEDLMPKKGLDKLNYKCCCRWVE